MSTILAKIYYKFAPILERIKLECRLCWIRKYIGIKILSEEKTIQEVLLKGCSLARFGDGEMGIMLRSSDIAFQESSELLSSMLKKVASSDNENLLVCLPHGVVKVAGYKKEAATFWRDWTLNYGIGMYQLFRDKIEKKYVFGDTQVTRIYMDWKSPKKAEKIFPMIKAVWDNRNILIVEGALTRLGVGNDLFHNAKTIKRIICPSLNAFSYYDRILRSVIESYNGELVLLALGPTATVLAFELSNRGIQALDIGHVDVEYEWFLKGAKQKSQIEGKYVNEVPEGRIVSSNTVNEEYQSQIIETIL